MNFVLQHRLVSAPSRPLEHHVKRARQAGRNKLVMAKSLARLARPYRMLL